MLHTVDLRSDTVTKPTQAMMVAMAKAEVGDDGYGEDPTVRELEEKAADTVGKESALFLPSGTMGNLVAVMTHSRHRKSEFIAEFHSHILGSEGGGYAHVAGVAARGIKGENGVLDSGEVEACIRSPNVVHQPRTALICVESSHNYYGGTVAELAQLNALSTVADRHGLPMHLDGARVFNAAKALKVPARKIAAPFGSVMFCLSKGLSAPVGSILAGERDFIRDARHYRRILGGGMRQAGVLAAAGLVALSDAMIDRVGEDNARAAMLARRLAQLPGFGIDLAATRTNIVRIDTSKAAKRAGEIAGLLREEGILCNVTGQHTLRLVTHRHITDADIECACTAFERVLALPPKEVSVSNMIY